MSKRERERDTERYVECEKGFEFDLKEGCCFGSHIVGAITLSLFADNFTTEC